MIEAQIARERVGRVRIRGHSQLGLTVKLVGTGDKDSLVDGTALAAYAYYLTLTLRLLLNS